MYNRKFKNDIHLLKSARKSFKRRLKIKLRNQQIRKAGENVPSVIKKGQIIKNKLLQNFSCIKAPNDFSLCSDTNKFVKFINECDKVQMKRSKPGIAFDLRYVENLDFSAIGLLIALVYRLKLNRIDFNGINPIKSQLCDILNYYNFFQQIGIKPSYDNIHFSLGQKGDRITIKGDKKVKPELGIDIAKYISEKLFSSTDYINDGFYTLFLELMANTTKWSQQQNDNNLWLLIMSYDHEQKKIDFQFIDFGVGIFGSLNQSQTYSKWYGFITSKVASNAKILESMLNGTSSAYKSSTGLYFRGKGIPSIKEGFDNNYYQDVEILTNNVYVNLSTNEFRSIDHNFSGTLIKWSIAAKNNFIKFAF